MQKKYKVAVLCGGPSPERGISLNSARSILDHLGSDTIDIIPIYFDHQKQPYLISTAQLYSNTPLDFDFKLHRHGRFLSQSALIRAFKKCDIVFPAMHGAYGEDGQIQKLLEEHKIPFIGSGSKACARAFDKYRANEFVKAQGFFTLPSTVLKIYADDHREIIEAFFTRHQITRAIVKPATGGSSIGVFSVSTVDEALERVRYLFSKRVDTRVVIEPFCTGTEFTVILLQNRFGQPVAILPTEIETDYTKHQIFDYRKKYLPTRQVTYHCPPRFSNDTIEQIQYQAEQLFLALGMADFARFDGWLLPDGQIWFSDFNPISGMEQNSFLFQQASRLGFSHGDLLHYIVRQSAARQDIDPPPPQKLFSRDHRKPISVLFGGATSERQVSLMSGTNVWLKLRKSKIYRPEPYLLDPTGVVWHLPYMLTLNHTVEEITEHARNAAAENDRLELLERRARLRLALEPGDTTEVFFLPERLTLEEFIRASQYVFIGLHGGMGEDGRLQKLLTTAKKPYNGSDAHASQLCMDKAATGAVIRAAQLAGIATAPQRVMNSVELKKRQSPEIWSRLKKDLHATSVIVKPIDDGCSLGIVRLKSAEELERYVELVHNRVLHVAAETFVYQDRPLEMPLESITKLLFEKFIDTDQIRVVGNALKITHHSGWVEVTVGILGKKGKMRALSPSLTVAEGQVLSLEEKFQGGTGINITPPAKEVMSPSVIRKVQDRIALIANALGLNDYARIDAFVDRTTGKVSLIEVNTLPGLTPSTVIFHQALAEQPSLFPTQFLEKIIATSGY